MKQVISFVLGVIAGGVVAWVWMHKRNGMERFNAERKKEREENKQKILKLLEEKGKIANDDVQDLLSVSDATATRYLQELETAGKIKQVGQEGRYTYYQKV